MRSRTHTIQFRQSTQFNVFPLFVSRVVVGNISNLPISHRLLYVLICSQQTIHHKLHIIRFCRMNWKLNQYSLIAIELVFDMEKWFLEINTTSVPKDRRLFLFKNRKWRRPTIIRLFQPAYRTNGPAIRKKKLDV